MKQLILAGLLFTVLTNTAYSQIIDIDYHKNRRGFAADSSIRSDEEDKVQVLKNGFVDFVSDGNIQASARLLRINIGERDKFYLPLFIYTGASGKTFGQDKLNQTTVSNLLNPIGGALNVSFNGLKDLINGSEITKLKFAYQFGGRLVNGSDSITKDNMNFFNGFANVGFFFQTGAWTPDDPTNMGVFYLQAKFTSSFSSKSNLEQVFGKSVLDKSYFIGYSVDAGIEIDKIISLKLGLYQYINNANISLLKNPVVKISLDYTFKK